MNIKKINLSLLLLAFVFLPSLGIALGSIFIPFLFIIEGLFLALLMFNKHFLIDLTVLFKKTPCLYLLLFLLWSTFTVIVSFTKGTFYLNSFIFSYIGGLIFCVFAPLTISYFINKRNLDVIYFIKFYLVICFFILLLGLIESILRHLNIDIANFVMSLFNNKRMMLFSTDPTQLQINRIKSIFDEPSNLGEFIYLNLPIIYSLSFSKYKIFKNLYFNMLIKKFLPILTFIDLILTKSPISLLFILIISLIYFYKKIINNFLKQPILYFVTITIIICIFDIFTLEYTNINIQATYLNRIIETIPSLFSINTLIIVEPSLATRIINYGNNLQVFINNPVVGVGYGNMSKYILVQMEQSNLPMTLELWQNLRLGAGNVASAIVYRVLAETGFIGYICLLIFVFKTYKLNNLLFKNSIGIERDFLYGINYYLLVFITIV